MVYVQIVKAMTSVKPEILRDRCASMLHSRFVPPLPLRPSLPELLHAWAFEY
jgi:hypothetical protein